MFALSIVLCSATEYNRVSDHGARERLDEFPGDSVMAEANHRRMAIRELMLEGRLSMEDFVSSPWQYIFFS